MAVVTEEVDMVTIVVAVNASVNVRNQKTVVAIHAEEIVHVEQVQEIACLEDTHLGYSY